ncbi:hypothetical protein [Rhizobium sp. R693]|uniref:hypothetical protein n=1 Tax=Rhizobium sp. R693 TaxID=1764276 RepID=UPI000B52FF2C|nr:hypothetical protein [Rhizobium sp. R693]OWV90382.1 hypothetical protein ATY79_28485 [Rhizobium sp. R693]
MTDSKASVDPFPNKIVKGMAATWMLLGVLPFFFPMFGRSFLPSIKWITEVDGFGIAAGLGSGALSFWLMVRRYDSIKGNEFKKFIVVVFAPMLGFVFGRNVIVVVAPMILALLLGNQTELQFIVASSNDSGTKGCRSPLVLKELPFLFDRLCGIPNETRGKYMPGDYVFVSGRGTNLGLFPASLTRQ